MDAHSRLVPPGSRETFVASGGGVFRVLQGTDEGPGTPILLIHGGGSDNAAISWYRLIPEFARQRRVIAPDLPGFGYTAYVPPARSAAGMADQLSALIDELDVDRVIVCGVSMGGEVALQLALRDPDRVEAVIAIAPGGLIEQWRGPLAHRLAWIGTLIPDAVLVPLTALANRFVRTMINRMVRDPATLPDVVVEEFVTEARRPHSGYAYSLYNRSSIARRRMTNNLLPHICELETPTLFFHGAEDPLVDPAGSLTAAERMPHARLELVPDCGHWAQLEQHDRFVAAVAAFLSDR